MRNIILDNKSRKCSRNLQEHAHLYFVRNSPHRLIPLLFWNDNNHVGCVPRTIFTGAWDAPYERAPSI